MLLCVRLLIEKVEQILRRENRRDIMKKYVKPEAEITKFETVDVVTTSGPWETEIPGPMPT